MLLDDKSDTLLDLSAEDMSSNILNAPQLYTDREGLLVFVRGSALDKLYNFPSFSTAPTGSTFQISKSILQIL